MAPHAERLASAEYHNTPLSKHSTKPPHAVQQDEEIRAKKSLADTYKPGYIVPLNHDNYEFDHLRPRWPDVQWKPLEEFSYTDKGLQGSHDFRSLLDAADDVFDYTPKIGTEIRGIKLSQLTEQQKCDLARLTAIRGVVFFRGQDDLDINAQRQLGEFFGPLHKHFATGIPEQEGLEDVHVVWLKEGALNRRSLETPSGIWHSDATYEINPPAYTCLKLLTGPPRGGGGDTLWASMYAAYDMLSPQMQKYLEGLTAIHSADEQSKGNVIAGLPIRRESINTEHPLVRVHPVTGWKSLFFDPLYTAKIKGVPKLESDAIMAYLTEVFVTNQDAFCRFQWGKHDVAFWDNRCINHSGTFGVPPHRRHAVRVTACGEKPYFDPAGRSQEEELNAKWGIPQVSKDGSGFAQVKE